MIAVRPKVASSELSGDTAKRDEQPLHRHAEREEQRDDQRERASGSMPPTLAS